MNKTYPDILDSVAGDHIHADLNLLPRIMARLERKTLMQTLRAKPALFFFVILLALTLLTSVAYAISRSLGYIPGIGLVEQGAPIRVLAEPVSVERDGITLTVKQTVLTVDQTVVVFRLENIPWEAFSHDENVGGCYATPSLRLPDGKALDMIEGGGSANEIRFVYPAIPPTVNEATFVLPCIQNTLPGKAPENWQLALRFVPAPPEMTVIPVVEIQPTPVGEVQPAPVKDNPAPEAPTAVSPSPLTLTKAMQINDRYILLGTLTQPEPESGRWIQLTASKIIDAEGKEVYTSIPTVEGLPTYDWGFQFDPGGVTFPVTLTFSGYQVNIDPHSQAEFEFDAGENPQTGQEWTPNQDIFIAGHTLKLLTVRAARDGYDFEFSSEPEVVGVSLNIAGYTPMGGGGGGGGSSFWVSVAYDSLPKGKLNIILSGLSIAGPSQTWTLQWGPQNIPATAPLYGIALKLDKFIPLDDGYYLIGHTEWTDERITGVTEYGTLQAFDANGQEAPLEKVKFAQAITLGENLEADQWVYRLGGTTFDAPLTLRLSQVGIEFKQPLRFTLDLRSYGFSFANDQVGSPWKTGLTPLDIPGLEANLFRVTYVREGNRHGFEFAIESDPRLQSLGLDFESGVTGEIGRREPSFRRDPQSGLLLVTVLTDGQISMPLSMVAYGADVQGEWTTTWTPPAR